MSTELEDRVRQALSARAGQITPDRLQPAVPPTATPARRPRLRWWHPLLVVAAVLVTVVFAIRLPGDSPSPLPNAPAGTVPAPSPSEPAAPTAEPVPSTTDLSESQGPTVTVPVPTASAPVAPAPPDALPTSQSPSPAESPRSSPAATPRPTR